MKSSNSWLSLSSGICHSNLRARSPPARWVRSCRRLTALPRAFSRCSTTWRFRRSERALNASTTPASRDGAQSANRHPPTHDVRFAVPSPALHAATFPWRAAIIVAAAHRRRICDRPAASCPAYRATRVPCFANRPRTVIDRPTPSRGSAALGDDRDSHDGALAASQSFQAQLVPSPALLNLPSCTPTMDPLTGRHPRMVRVLANRVRQLRPPLLLAWPPKA